MCKTLTLVKKVIEIDLNLQASVLDLQFCKYSYTLQDRYIDKAANAGERNDLLQELQKTKTTSHIRLEICSDTLIN